MLKTSIFIFIASYAICVRAADTGQPLGLEGAIASALRNNPELRVFEAGISASKGSVTTARAFANPELTFAPGIKRVREESGTQSEFHGEIGLSQLFTFPGKRALEIAMAERNVELQELALEGFRFQLETKVRRAFFGMLAAEKIVALRKEQADAARVFAESAKKRAEEGYASDFEILKGQADVIAASKARQSALSDVASAKVALNVLMGRDPAASLSILGKLEGLSSKSTQADLVALAMARNPALRTLAKQADLAGLSLRSMRFSRRPDFAVGPSIEYTDKEQIIGLSATVALPLWNQKKGEVQTATAEQQKAIAEIEKGRMEIRGEVVKATAAFKIAQDAAALYTPAFLGQLKTLVAQAEQSYAQSATTLIIYLDAKRTYFDTLGDYYEAQGRMAACFADLESAVGVPINPTQR